MSLNGIVQLGLCENRLVRCTHVLRGFVAVVLFGMSLLDDNRVDALKVLGASDKA